MESIFLTSLHFISSVEIILLEKMLHGAVKDTRVPEKVTKQPQNSTDRETSTYTTHIYVTLTNFAEISKK